MTYIFKPKFLISYSVPFSSTDNRIMIAADCLLPKSFTDIIALETGCLIDYIYIDSTRESRLSVIMRHISYIVLALKCILLQKNYKFIFFWQQYICLYWSVFSRIFPFSQVKAGIIPFIFFERKKRILGMLHKNFFWLGLNNSKIAFILCHSSSEIEFYSNIFNIVKDKFFYIPLGIESGTFIEETNFDNYFFSGGTSNRDYDTIVKAFEKMHEKIIIACTKGDIPPSKMKDNIIVDYEAYGEKFDNLMKKSKAVIITLLDPNISAGQLVLLKAMSMGKIIIVTESEGVKDYITDSCGYLIKNKSVSSLIKAVEEINKDFFAAKAKGKSGYIKFNENFSMNKLAENIALNMKTFLSE